MEIVVIGGVLVTVILSLIGIVVWLAKRENRKVIQQLRDDQEALQYAAEEQSKPLPTDPDDAVDLLRDR